MDPERRRRCVATLALTLASCAPVPSDKGNPTVGASHAVAGPIAPPRAPASPPGPSAAASSAPDNAPGDPVWPSRMEAPGSTRGTIACGKERCDAQLQTCFFDDDAAAWACGPRVNEPSGLEPGMRCDDGTDCPHGLTCCDLFETSGSVASSCVPRAEVDARCRIERCQAGGAKCPPGRRCTATTDAEEGWCEAPKGPATCAGKKPCPADKPICVMTTTVELQCVARDSPEFAAAKPSRRWECTTQADCHAGDRCSYAFGEIEHPVDTYCSKYSPAYGGSMICDPKGASPCGADAACRKMYECKPNADAPPWLGVWATK